MNTRTLTPIRDRIAVQMLPRETRTAGGLHIPEVSQTTHEWGKVLAAGEQVKEIQQGDEVYVNPRQGTHFTAGGQDFIMLRESEVLARRVYEA